MIGWMLGWVRTLFSAFSNITRARALDI